MVVKRDRGRRWHAVGAVFASLLALASCGGSDTATTDVTDRDDGSTESPGSESQSTVGTSAPTDPDGPEMEYELVYTERFGKGDLELTFDVS